MTYKIIFSERAKKQLQKLDKSISALILGWIEKNLQECTDPRVHGKALKSNRKGQWRYRIGDYRLICEIQDDVITVLVLEVGHRRGVYSEN